MMLGAIQFRKVGHFVLGEDESNQRKDREKAFQMPERLMPAPPHRQAQKGRCLLKMQCW
jgi:hypothetical protein